MKYFFDKKNTLQVLKNLSVVFFAAFILSLLPFSFSHTERGITGVHKAYAETAAEAEDRASLAAQRAGKAAADARIAAAAAEQRYEDSRTYTDEGAPAGGDESLRAVAENARRLADNAETAHKAASFAAGSATKAAAIGDEATAIQAADTATIRATDAQNYNQQITGIIANPKTATTNEGAVNKGGGDDTAKNTCWLGITSGGFNWEYCFYLWLAYAAYFIIWLASWVLGMAGLVLDQVMQYSLVEMSANLRGITGINIAWQAFRDIANMSFIFILLYVGISTIINGASGKTNTMLRNVVIVAILINFSLFFTKVIIDISNILALGFYNGIVNQGGGTGFTISTAFMKPLGLTSIFNIGSSATALADKGFQHVIIMGIGGTAFILTAAFTFLFAAGLFLIRFAVIIILLLLSPLAYAGQILPATQGQAKKWWDSLMGQVIFAPAYMLMLWGVLKIVNNGLFGTNPSTTGFADALAGTANAGQLGAVGGASNVGIIVNFVIIIILLNACVIIAKTFAGRSGAFVNKAIGKAEGYARRWTTDAGKSVGGVPINIGQRAARSTIGFTGRKMGKMYDNAEAKLRQNEFFKSNAGALSTMTGGLSTTVGKALSRSARDTLKGVENAKVGTGETYADVRKANLERDKFISSRQREMDTEKKVKDGIEALTIDQTTLNPAEKKLVVDRIDAMEQAINKLTDKEIEAFVDDIGADKFASSGIMERMNVRQLQALNKSEKFTEEEKTAFIEARLKPVSTAITEAESLRNLGVLDATQQKRLADLDSDIKKRIRAINDQEMEIVGNKILENKEMEAQAIKHMTGGQFDGIQKSNAFTRTQKQSVKDAREKPLKDAFAAGDTATMASILRGMKANDIAKLDKDILKDSKTVGVLTPAMMNKFVDELEPSVLKDIGDQITAIGPTHAAHKFVTTGKTAEFFK